MYFTQVKGQSFFKEHFDIVDAICLAEGMSKASNNPVYIFDGRNIHIMTVDMSRESVITLTHTAREERKKQRYHCICRVS